MEMVETVKEVVWGLGVAVDGLKSPPRWVLAKQNYKTVGNFHPIMAQP